MQSQFFTFRSYTINISQIVEIEWKDDKLATVVMSSGRDYDVDDTDYHALRQALGL